MNAEMRTRKPYSRDHVGRREEVYIVLAFCLTTKIALYQEEIHLLEGKETRHKILGKRLQIVQREVV